MRSRNEASSAMSAYFPETPLLVCNGPRRAEASQFSSFSPLSTKGDEANRISDYFSRSCSVHGPNRDEGGERTRGSVRTGRPPQAVAAPQPIQASVPGSMTMSRLLSLLKRIKGLKSRRPRTRPAPARLRLCLEHLEDRCLLTSITELSAL